MYRVCKRALAGMTLLIGNCFITYRLLIDNTFGRAPEFVSTGYFCANLVTTVLLIELYPMVPLVAKLPFVVSQPTLRYSDLITVTVARAEVVSALLATQKTPFSRRCRAQNGVGPGPGTVAVVSGYCIKKR